MILRQRNIFCWKWYSTAGLFSPLIFNYLKCQNIVRCFSMLKQSFLTDISLDINVHDLQEKHKRLAINGKRLNIHKMMEEELDRRCLDVINTFGSDNSRFLKIIQLEHNILYAEGFAVTAPEKMTNKMWIEAMTCSSKDERLQYYLFTERKANIRAQWTNCDAEADGESDKSFIYIKDNDEISRWGDHLLASAMSYGIPLVFDMEFDDLMTSRDIGRTAKQLWMAYRVNHIHTQPFHFVFAGCQKTNSIYRTLELRHLLKCHHFMVSEMDKSYLELFPKESLVYLSPNAKQILRSFDPNSVYVLGTYSGGTSSLTLGSAKAKEQKVQCMKLPIDESIKWIQGSKDLSLSSVVKLLLDSKAGIEWKDAFAGVLNEKNFRHYKEQRQ